MSTRCSLHSRLHPGAALPRPSSPGATRTKPGSSSTVRCTGFLLLGFVFSAERAQVACRRTTVALAQPGKVFQGEERLAANLNPRKTVLSSPIAARHVHQRCGRWRWPGRSPGPACRPPSSAPAARRRLTALGPCGNPGADGRGPRCGRRGDRGDRGRPGFAKRLAPQAQIQPHPPITVSRAKRDARSLENSFDFPKRRGGEHAPLRARGLPGGALANDAFTGGGAAGNRSLRRRWCSQQARGCGQGGANDPNSCDRRHPQGRPRVRGRLLAHGHEVVNVDADRRRKELPLRAGGPE